MGKNTVKKLNLDLCKFESATGKTKDSDYVGVFGKDAFYNVYNSFMNTKDRWFSGARMLGAIYDNHHYFGLCKEDNLIKLLKDNNYNICEVLCEYPKRLYFDYDFVVVEGATELPTIKKMKKLLKKYFGLYKTDYTIAGYETDKKISYHIVCKDLYIMNDDELIRIKSIVSYLKSMNGLCFGFDNWVYTPNRQMKCIYQSKPNGNRAMPLYPKEYDEKDFFINSFLSKTPISYFHSGRKLYDTLNEALCVRTVKPKYASVEPILLPKNVSDADLMQAKTLLDLMPSTPNLSGGDRLKVAIFCHFNGISRTEYWDWFMKSNPSRERQRKLKKTLDDNAHTNEKYAVSIDCFKKYLSIWYPELNDKTRHNERFMSSFKLPIKATIIDRLEPELFEVDKKVVVCNIGMGGGKTTTTLHYLKRTLNQSFVWLAPRQTLVLNTYYRMQTEFEIPKVVSHLHVGSDKSKLRKASKLLICNQSLHHLDTDQHFDNVVIDEIETVLMSWLDEETHKLNMGTNFKKFCSLLQQAKKIILLDAFTTTKTFNMINTLGIENKDIILYESKHKPVERQINVVCSFNKMLNNIAKDVADGKKCFIFYAFKNATEGRNGINDFNMRVKEQAKTMLAMKETDEAKRMEFIEKDANDIFKSCVYYAESYEKNNLGNINEKWHECDFVLTTSSITVGVNYELEDFDKVYIYASGSTNLPRDIIQSSMRIRYPKTKDIDIHFFDVKTKEIEVFPEYYKCDNLVYKSLVDDNLNEKHADFIDAFSLFCKATNYKFEYDINEMKKNKREKYENNMFVSRMLMEYSLIKEVDEEKKDTIELKIFNREATMEDRMIVLKHYFDITFRNLNKDDRAYVWNTNTRNFFTNINNPDLNNILKDNNLTSICEAVNLKELVMTPETEKLINKNYSKSHKNINSFTMKVINKILGFEAIKRPNNTRNTKRTNFQIDDKIPILYDIIQRKAENEQKEKEEKEAQFIEEEEKKQQQLSEIDTLKQKYTPEYFNRFDSLIKTLEFITTSQSVMQYLAPEDITTITSDYELPYQRTKVDVIDIIPNVKEMYALKHKLGYW